jgi:ribonucleoside-diphosphate reductase subunit M2
MSSKQYTYFPIEHPQIHELLQKQFANFWTVEEVDTSEDKKHWTQVLKTNEKEFIKWTLGFFASADGIVIENLGKRFFEDINNSEGKAFYAFQMGMEAIHSIMYSVLIDTYVSDPKEKAKMFNAIEEIPPIKAKADWALQWISDNSNFAKRCVAFAIVEGIFFSAAFCSIYWLKDRGVCPGLCLSNDFIARDEALHVEHACEQYKIGIANDPKIKLSSDEVYSMVRSAIDTEDVFINEALKFRLKGMNADLMKEYVRYTADHLLGMLGYQKLYNVQNPFDFMDRISMDQLNNFFEGRSSVYQRSGIMDSSKKNGNAELDQESAIELIKDFVQSQGIKLDDTNCIQNWYDERQKGYRTYSMESIDEFDF